VTGASESRCTSLLTLRGSAPDGRSFIVRSPRSFVRVARSTLKRVSIAVFTWIVAFVVLTGVARAGRPFVYCHTMEVLQSECCCTHPDSDAYSDADENVTATEAVASAEMPCCCERGSMPSMPPMASAELPHLPSAPLVAMIPPVDPLHSALVARAIHSPPRAHLDPTPPPLSAAASCTRLSVFLI